MTSTIVDLNASSSSNAQQQHQDPVIHLHSGNSTSSSSSHHANNNNNTNNNNNNNNNSNNAQAGNGGGGGAPDNAGTAAILARLKELEAANQQLTKHLDDVRSETQKKEEKIKLLSADKRKDMEQIIETAIDTWLNSLTGVSEDVRKQFRTGVSRIAEQADLKNAAWEVVCQASQLHQTNVNRIEELLQTCNSQSETIKSLVGSGTAASQMQNDPSFSSEASRMMHAKRQRTGNGDDPSSSTYSANAGLHAGHYGGGGGQAVPVPGGGGGDASANGHTTTNNNNNMGDAWDMFDGLLREQSRALYY
jgi:hypothetical protein